MDYAHILLQALRFTVKHPVLWVLGFLAGLSETSVDFLGINPDALPDPGRGQTPAEVAALLESHLLQIVGYLPFTLAFSLMGLVGYGGLVAAVEQIEREGRADLGFVLWRTFGRYHHLLAVFIVFGLGLTFLYVMFAGLPTIVLYRGLGEGSASLVVTLGTVLFSLLAFAGLVCVVVPYVVISAGVQTFAERAIMLERYGAFRGTLRAGRLMFSNLGTVAVVALIILIITVIVAMLAGLITEVPLTLVVAALNVEETVFDMPVKVIGRALTSAVFVAYYSTVWTLVYQGLVEREARRSTLLEQQPTRYQVS